MTLLNILQATLLLLILSLGLNAYLYAALRKAEARERRATGASVLNQALAGELERKLGPRKAARLIHATTDTIRQQAATKGV